MQDKDGIALVIISTSFGIRTSSAYIRQFLRKANGHLNSIEAAAQPLE